MARARDGSLVVDVSASQFAVALFRKICNELPRSDDEEAEDHRIMLDKADGLPRRVEFPWQRYGANKLGTGVKIRLAGIPCTVNLPSVESLGIPMITLQEYNNTNVGYWRTDAGKLFLDSSTKQELDVARRVGIALQRINLDHQHIFLRAVRYWVASRKLYIWWVSASQSCISPLLEELDKIPVTSTSAGTRAAVQAFLAEGSQIEQDAENLTSEKFWKVFFETIYWEHELVPEGGIPGVFLPGGDREGPIGDAEGGEPIDGNLEPEEQALGEILENLAGFEEGEPVVEAEEPEMVLEIGEDIDPADPRLHTPRAESYRKLGCKRFVEPLGDIFGNDNGYFAALLLTAEAEQVIAFDTDEEDNAAYLIRARVEGDADAKAWIDDALKPKVKVRRARRFVRRFYHVLGWEKNVRRWLEEH